MTEKLPQELNKEEDEVVLPEDVLEEGVGNTQKIAQSISFNDTPEKRTRPYGQVEAAIGGAFNDGPKVSRADLERSIQKAQPTTPKEVKELEAVRTQLGKVVAEPSAVPQRVRISGEANLPPVKKGFWQGLKNFFSKYTKAPEAEVQKSPVSVSTTARAVEKAESPKKVEKKSEIGTESGWLARQKAEEPRGPNIVGTSGASTLRQPEKPAATFTTDSSFRVSGPTPVPEHATNIVGTTRAGLVRQAPTEPAPSATETPENKAIEALASLQRTPEKKAEKVMDDSLGKLETVAKLHNYFSGNNAEARFSSGREQVKKAVEASKLLENLKTLKGDKKEIADFQKKVDRDVEDAVAQLAIDVVNSKQPKAERAAELGKLLAQKRIGSYAGPGAKEYVLNVLRGVKEARAGQRERQQGDAETTAFIREFLAHHG